MKKNITIISIFLSLLLSNVGVSKAVLQSNGNEGVTYNLSDWMMNVRKMEELGGAMGLEETVNSDLSPSSGSNKIDVHMQKNTEYGALAILSASSYGNPNKIEDGQTTTGNNTGVVMHINTEWVAAGATSDATNYNNALTRYKNYYSGDYNATHRIGDATGETADWHGSGDSTWIANGSYNGALTISCYNLSGFVRSNNGSIFSYNGRASYGWNSNGGHGGYWHYQGSAVWNYSYHSRAVIVQGDDF